MTGSCADALLKRLNHSGRKTAAMQSRGRAAALVLKVLVHFNTQVISARVMLHFDLLGCPYANLRENIH